MTLPVQTWRISTPFSIVKAGAMTNVELLTAIHNALNADTNNHWMVAGQNLAADGWLLLKRKGSPSGTLGTARILIACSTSVTVSAALPGEVATTIPANTPTIGMCEDAAVDTITTTVTVGNPFPGKKYSGQIRMCGNFATSSQLGVADAGDIVFVSCDRALAVFVRRIASTPGFCLGLAGEIVERADDGAALWGCTGSSGMIADVSKTYQLGYGLLSGIGNWNAQPMLGAYHNGVVARAMGVYPTDPYTGSAHNPLLSLANTGVLVPLLLAEAAPWATSHTVYNFLGLLRQIRVGPFGIGMKYVRDGNNVVQAIFVNCGTSGSGLGVYFDQNA
mgnify:CR=1 FL=1